MNLNKVILCGRVTKQPEITQVGQEHRVAKLSIATNMFQGKDKKDKTTFHNLVAWNKIADTISQYVVVGQEIIIEGNIDNRSYENKEGVKKYISEVIVERLQLGAKPKGMENESNYNSNSTASYSKSTNDDNIPIIEDIDPNEIDIKDIPF